MGLQLRIKNGSDERFYDPNRDLAYCSQYLFDKAFRDLQNDKQEGWVYDYCKQHNISKDDIFKCTIMLSKYLNEKHLDPNIKTPFEGLESLGFFDLPIYLRTLVLAKLGIVLIGASFFCMRDALNGPEQKPLTFEQLNADLEDALKKLKQRDSFINKLRRGLRKWFNWNKK